MTQEEMLEGLTNDLVLLRLQRFLVGKGLPEGRYLLDNAQLDTDQGVPHRGSLELVRPDEEDSEEVRVVITFICSHVLNEHLSLEINKKHPPIIRNGELIYRFSGVLRPIEGKAS
jgi:hypothetical protein